MKSIIQFYIKIGSYIIDFNDIIILNNSYYYILDENNENKPLHRPKR